MQSTLHYPEKIHLARLKTPIYPLDAYKGVKLYLKADDLTEFGLSGNKVRKLEYLLAEAQRAGATDVITCGGTQSNHARATALAARRIGMVPHLLLRGREQELAQGNLLIDHLAGAEIRFCGADDYRNKREALMMDWAAEIERSGDSAYVIPEGGSRGVGLYGYAEAFEEILEQESEMEAPFDLIVAALGSGGTHAGLVMGADAHGTDHRILGINIYDATVDGVAKVNALIEAIGLPSNGKGRLTVDNRFVGDGYGQSNPGDLEEIRRMAREKGFLFDTVYTGKALAALYRMIDAGEIAPETRLLFIHTGGFFGNFSVAGKFHDR